jgi:hypothetical protein
MKRTRLMEGVSSKMYYEGYVPTWYFRAHVRYVFFEKKRIAEGKEKTELRLRQEKAFPGGRDVSKNAFRQSILLGPGSSASLDDLGRIVIHRAH